MSGRLDKTLADYLAIAVSPALIMTLVGSLVFFLLEVFYQGHFHGRLQWILGLFVIAAVLIGRISIEEGTERASLFALPLAVLTAIAIYRFVSTDLWPLAISLGLMGLIWWCAHKLTWDCTLIDEEQDASGEGLLQVVGLDETPEAMGGKSETNPKSAAEDLQTGSPGLAGFVSNFMLRISKSAKSGPAPHAPGVWIVYFSLAALPVFGLGQRLIPAADVESRRFAFWLLCVYVASGLGLLVTTSFLGLRRYLRQRHLQMPASMAGAWIAVGCVLAMALLVVAALLPRPASEYAVSDLPFGLGALEHKSSRYAVGEEGVEDDQRTPRPGKPADHKPDQKRDQKPDHQSAEQSGDQSGDSSDEESGEQSSEKDASEQSGGGKQPNGKAKGDGSKEKDGGGEQSEKGGSPKKGQSKGKNSQPSRQNSDDSGNEEKQQGDARSEQPQGSEDSEPEAAENDGQAGQPPPSRNLLPHTTGGWLATLLRWLVYGVLIAVAAVWLWRSRDKVRAGFRELIEWLKSLWEQLFAAKAKLAAADAQQPEAEPELRPFSSYPDPFATGLADRYTPERLVRYSFEALEAWARDYGWPRASDETPHEFAVRLGSRVGPLARDARRLADFYCTVAYAQGTLPAASADHLRNLWQQLYDVRPMQPTTQP